MARHCVGTLREAGIDRIVVVTGYRAEELEWHLRGSGLIFLRNELYESNQMFDSASLGFGCLVNSCERILFTPIDVPLFSLKTVTALMRTDAPLSIPTRGGRRGHPILLSADAVRRVLADSGEGGLKGAYARCGVDIREVAVEDDGILFDADCPTDYRALVRFHSEQGV